MQNLGSIFDDVLYRSGKDKVGGAITPLDFNLGITRINSLYLTYLVNLFEETKQVSSDLRTLIKTAGNAQNPPIPLNQFGYGQVPTDYRYHARSYYNEWTNNECGVTLEYRNVHFVSQHEFSNRMMTSIYQPTKEEPIVLFEGTELRVLPKDLGKFSLTYIKYAKDPFFDYDIIDGVPVYLPKGEFHVNSSVLPQGTPSQSEEFEYPIEAYDNLTQILVAYFAIGNKSEFNLATIKALLNAQ